MPDRQRPLDALERLPAQAAAKLAWQV